MADQTDTSIAPSSASKRCARGADTELLELCAAWRQAVDRSIPILDRLANMLPSDETAADLGLELKVEREMYALEQRIFRIKAATLAGLKAKAGVLAHLETQVEAPAGTAEYASSLAADIMVLGADW